MNQIAGERHPMPWRRPVEPPKSFGDDWVILGGGTCGLLVAMQLLRRTSRTVWVIESASRASASPKGRSSGDPSTGEIDSSQPQQATLERWRRRPVDWLRLLGSDDDYGHQTAVEGHLAGRQLPWPRGRGLGGSGRINAMIWMPPAEQDFQVLSEAGLDRTELEKAYRLAVSIVRPETPRWLSESSRRFLSAAGTAAAACGHDAWAAPFQRMNRHGRRWTFADGLDESLGRNEPQDGLPDERPDERPEERQAEDEREVADRLRVVRGDVLRVEVKASLATALQLATPAGVARCELGRDAGLISSLGALGTPALCLRSGIGPADAFGGKGRLVAEVPGLGDNLHDHLIMPLIWRVPGEPFAAGPWTTRAICEWTHGWGGPIASNIAECGGLSPDGLYQVHVTPTDYLRFPQAGAPSAMSIGVNLTRPTSRGKVRLPFGGAADGRAGDGDRWTPVDPFDLLITPAYLSTAEDREMLLQAVRWARELAGTQPLAGWCGKEVVPGTRRQTDSQLLASIARYAQTLYHPGGTCVFNQVVDRHFRLRGVDNLRVIDASVLPCPTVANPTATLAMLAIYAVGEMLSA